MGLCDRVTVLDYGKHDRRRAARPTSRRDPAVIEAYLGRPAHAQQAAVAPVDATAMPCTSVSRACKVAYGGIQAVKGVDLEVRRASWSR